MHKYFGWKSFLTEAGIFLLAQILGLATGFALLQKEIIPQMTDVSSIATFIITFIIATAILLIILKFYKGKSFFKLFFILLLIVGADLVFSAFIPGALSKVLALALVALWLLLPIIFIHNMTILIAIAGIGTSLGLVLSLPIVLILLAALSIYDVVAVFTTKHMVTMFKDLMNRGVILSIIVPVHLKNMFLNLKKVKLGEGFMLLGTGDIAFPLILAVSALRISLAGAVGAMLGSIVGLFLIYILLVTQPQRRALPALPPIAVCSFLGFLIASRFF